MLTWNRPLKMKHLKRGKIYYQWNHESIYVINFVSHKNDFDDLNLKWVLSKSWSWFIKLNELKMNDDFSLEWLWLVFLVFMIWFLCNSLYSWNIYLITQLFLFQYSSSDDMNAWDIHEFILMYANEKFRSCMVGCNVTN